MALIQSSMIVQLEITKGFVWALAWLAGFMSPRKQRMAKMRSTCRESGRDLPSDATILHLTNVPNRLVFAFASLLRRRQIQPSYAPGHCCFCQPNGTFLFFCPSGGSGRQVGGGKERRRRSVRPFRSDQTGRSADSLDTERRWSSGPGTKVAAEPDAAGKKPANKLWVDKIKVTLTQIFKPIGATAAADFAYYRSSATVLTMDVNTERSVYFYLPGDVQKRDKLKTHLDTYSVAL